MDTILSRRGFLALLLVAPMHASGAEVVTSYSIVQRHVDRPPPTLVVQRGDRVTLTWRSDEVVTIHLHGYDVPLALTPGQPGQMRVNATVLGRFPVTAHGFGTDGAKHHGHHSEQPLVFLEVRPE